MASDSDPAKTPADVEEQKGEGAEAEPEAPPDDKKRKRDKKKRPRQVVVGEDRLNELEEKSKKADEYYGHYVRTLSLIHI